MTAKENPLLNANKSDFKRRLVKQLRKLWAKRWLYAMLCPFVLYFIIFHYKPLWGLQIAFKEYSVFRGMEGSPWVGFQNFIDFFESPYAWRVFRNTLIIGTYNLIFVFPSAIIFAFLLNEIRNLKFKKCVQTISYLPHFISTVVIAGMVTSFLAPTNGIINIILDMFGFDKVYFLTQPKYFRTILILMHIWSSMGYGSIVYIAAITGIDPQLYEACIIDGGGRWKQFLNVTLPGVMPTIITMLIMKVGMIISVGYQDIILLYQPVTYETADILGSYVYRMGIEGNNFGVSTAVGLLQSAISLVLVFLTNMLSKKVTETSLW